uniref:Calponin-homology (CH) domain-containing protein n=1 Tax=Cynoglossus semilaevis TaxID=244447 RepID=A0A3P8UYY5_CYNSE
MCNSKITLCGVSDQLNHRVWVFVDHVFLVSVRFCGISLLSFNHDFDLSTPGTHAATVRTSGNKCHTLCLSVYLAAVTGRGFGDRVFRGGLENGILLCELLSSIKPGLVKKINRLPTPIAGLVGH